MRSIERSFPVTEISLLAERESWRKEIFRPVYHIHKWWANRLGSVFRAIVLGAIADSESDIWHSFYKRHDFSDKVILDPFMGSGTTLGEAAKLGAKPIGCDINPISTFAVMQALTPADIHELESTFREIERDIQAEICRYYTTLDPQTGEPINALYYFWVKMVDTPTGESVPLFNTYVFSKNAYPKKNPLAQIICPECWQINAGLYDAKALTCRNCGHKFNPQHGPADGRYVTDSQGKKFEVKALLPASSPPRHKLYAIMALRASGEKIYLAPQAHDLALLEKVRHDLRREPLPLPIALVRPGHNTNQARGYNYLAWRDFFNERQLLCLGTLLRRILQVPNRVIRDQLLCLFSSTLEFNNLFCTFKGEGTGAVRHMFSHHILKPERTPLENNVWGTSKSSGSFSTLFESRLLKAKEYLDKPFELLLERDLFGTITGTRYTTASDPIHLNIVRSWEAFSRHPKQALILNGNSASLPIPDKSVDAVITDPPYFDFVHYSELSDFFFAWLAPVLAADYPFFNRENSYHKGEVQHKEPSAFAANLTLVFRESHRVLKDEGVLAFSFHHSRPEGWAAIYQALHDSGFQVVAAYPVHAEMRVGSPKSRTREPISIDIILVCRKTGLGDMRNQQATDFIEELGRAGIKLSQADHFNIRAGQLLKWAFCAEASPTKVKQKLAKEDKKTEPG